MTPAEAKSLLTWLSNADGRHRTTDATNAAAKIRVWAELLHDVTMDFAHQYARRYYGQTQQRDQMLSPGMIRSAWVTERDRLAAEEDRLDRERTYRQPLPGGLGKNRKPDWFDDLVKECDAARARGEDPERVAAVFRKPVVVGTPETRLKSCRVDICQCTHTDCTAGWLDEEESVPAPNGLSYLRVRRCPVCLEAMEMRGELAAPVRGGRR